MKEKVLVVDDETSIVTLLAFNIEKAGIATDVAYDGLEAIRKAEKHHYSLIVLDVMLPGKDGMEVCEHLRLNQIDTPILMLTARDEEENKIKGLELGADDYITKPFSPREVVARIKAILRRVNKEKKDIQRFIQIGDLTVFPDIFEAEINQHKLTLTRMEFELLSYLAVHKGLILSRDQLLSEIWNYDFSGDTRIVDVH